MKPLLFFTTPFIVSLLVLLSLATTYGGVNSQILNQINTKLDNTSEPEEKAKLYLYRARYLVKTKQYDEAIKDYDVALELDHQSWIHLERARIYLIIKNYDFAHSDAFAAKAENPALSSEADFIINKAAKELEKIQNMENPEDIVLDRDVDPYRKSRFDVARELGLNHTNQKDIYDWKQNLKANGKQATAKIKSSSGSNCKTKKS